MVERERGKERMGKRCVCAHSCAHAWNLVNDGCRVGAGTNIYANQADVGSPLVREDVPCVREHEMDIMQEI